MSLTKIAVNYFNDSDWSQLTVLIDELNQRNSLSPNRQIVAISSTPRIWEVLIIEQLKLY